MPEIKNYAWTTGRTLPDIDNGHIFERVNFTQKIPHTKIFEGKTGLTFRSCNLMNCDVPPDAIVEDCLIYHAYLCGNLHPEIVAIGKLDACAENCSHVVGSDDVTIDGQLVGVIYHYEDTTA